MPKKKVRGKRKRSRRRKGRGRHAAVEWMTGALGGAGKWLSARWYWWLGLASVTIVLGVTVGVREVKANLIVPVLSDGELVLWDELSPRLRDPKVGQIVSLRQRRGNASEVVARVISAGSVRASVAGTELKVPRGHLVVAVDSGAGIERRVVPVGDVSGEALLGLGRPMMEGASWKMRLPKRLP